MLKAHFFKYNFKEILAYVCEGVMLPSHRKRQDFLRMTSHEQSPRTDVCGRDG